MAREHGVSRATISQAMLLAREYGFVVGPPGAVPHVAPAEQIPLAFTAYDVAERARRTSNPPDQG